MESTQGLVLSEKFTTLKNTLKKEECELSKLLEEATKPEQNVPTIDVLKGRIHTFSTSTTHVAQELNTLLDEIKTSCKPLGSENTALLKEYSHELKELLVLAEELTNSTKSDTNDVSKNLDKAIACARDMFADSTPTPQQGGTATPTRPTIYQEIEQLKNAMDSSTLNNSDDQKPDTLRQYSPEPVQLAPTQQVRAMTKDQLEDLQNLIENTEKALRDLDGRQQNFQVTQKNLTNEIDTYEVYIDENGRGHMRSFNQEPENPETLLNNNRSNTTDSTNYTPPKKPGPSLLRVFAIVTIALAALAAGTYGFKQVRGIWPRSVS